MGEQARVRYIWAIVHSIHFAARHTWSEWRFVALMAAGVWGLLLLRSALNALVGTPLGLAVLLVGALAAVIAMAVMVRMAAGASLGVRTPVRAALRAVATGLRTLASALGICVTLAVVGFLVIAIPIGATALNERPESLSTGALVRIGTLLAIAILGTLAWQPGTSLGLVAATLEPPGRGLDALRLGRSVARSKRWQVFFLETTGLLLLAVVPTVLTTAIGATLLIVATTGLRMPAILAAALFPLTLLVATLAAAFVAAWWAGTLSLVYLEGVLERDGLTVAELRSRIAGSAGE